MTSSSTTPTPEPDLRHSDLRRAAALMAAFATADGEAAAAIAAEAVEDGRLSLVLQAAVLLLRSAAAPALAIEGALRHFRAVAVDQAAREADEAGNR